VTAPILCASIGIIAFCLVATGHGKPVLGIIRALIYARASWYLAIECFEGAKARLQRWPECLDRSRREA
jgi:hypothetical protein